MTLIQKNKSAIHLNAMTHEVFDVTGAGDTVIAVLAAAIASNQSVEVATMLANTAASLVVKKLGTATVTIDEINKNLYDEATSLSIPNKKYALELINEAKKSGKKIIMTNGCFDIIHTGHVRYLSKAKSLGDYLVIAVNDDESVKRLKGNGRPINALEDRMLVLNSLASVNLVIPFSQDTPEEIISSVNPDVLVKGGDYKEENIAGAESVRKSGGEVVIVPFDEGYSTSLILKKLKDKK